MSQTAQQRGLRMKVLGLSADAWRLAGSQALSYVESEAKVDLSRMRQGAVEEHLEGLPVEQSGRLWQELVDCGVAAKAGALAPAWAAAIVEAGSPRIGLRVVSGIKGMSMVSDLTINGSRGMAVTRRHALEDGVLGQAAVSGDDPNVEVALFSASDLWFALRRVLPPLEELRAEPHFTRPADRKVHVLGEQARAQFVAQTEYVSLESAGEVLSRTVDPSSGFGDAVLDPRASVSIAFLATPPEGGPIGMAIRVWTLGQAGLYAIASRPGAGAVAIEVEPGAIGAEVVWLLTGAMEYLSAASQAGRP